MLAHVNFAQHVIVHQPCQTIAQDILGNAQLLLKIDEAPGAIHGVQHNEEGPPVTHFIEGAGDGTAGIIKTFSGHFRSVPNRVAF